MRNFTYLILITIILAGLSGCKKEAQSVKVNSLNTPVQKRINKFLSKGTNTSFFCGGEKSESGFIYKSTDGGSSWKNVYSDSQHSLYDIFFVNDSVGYCCGEDMLLLRSLDGGENWQSTGNKVNSDDFFNGTLRSIFGTEKLLMIVGGKNFNIGIINWIKDGLVSSYYTGFGSVNNELRCGAAFGDDYFVLGYGTAHKTKNGRNTEPTDISGDFFTSVSRVNNSMAYACGYNGGIYKISNSGKDFEKVFDHNRSTKKRINFNSIFFKDELHGWVVGNDGVVYKTTDGSNFKELDLETKADLLSVTLDNNELVISTSEGKLLRIEP